MKLSIFQFNITYAFYIKKKLHMLINGIDLIITMLCYFSYLRCIVW